MVAAIVFVLTAAWFVYKERATLAWHVQGEAAARPTVIYSRWLDLKGDESLSQERIIAWLDLLGYKRTPSPPHSSGEYFSEGSRIILFTQFFHYPDKDLPVQLIQLDFSSKGLREMKALAGHAPLAEWRLEPRVLAEWGIVPRVARQKVRVEDLPPHVSRAVVAMEDKRFFHHGAFDWMGIGRAVWVDVKHGGLKQGASTITQQLARSIFLDIQRTWRRKFIEAILAIYLEIRYTKPQLLEMYLNQAYWGHDGTQTLIGIEAASQSLFGKTARKLTPAESASLAGMLQSPRRFSPRTSLKLSEERKKIVLGLMRDQKIITDADYILGVAQRVTLAPLPRSGESAYFLAHLRDELGERFEMSAMLAQGWSIYTTLDPLMQREAVQSLKPSVGQGGLVALDAKNGAVRAWVAGTNFQTNPFDHVADAKRQPGSAFKPFVVLAALENRVATTATMLDDDPISLIGLEGPWTPQNYDRKFRGKVSVWDSLVYSWNVPMVRLAMQTGLSHVVSVARRAGITSPLRSDLSTSLGSSEVSLLELTGAYGTLASGGRRLVPHSIRAIVSRDGQLVDTAPFVNEQTFAPEAVYLVTQMLQDVLVTGTGKASKSMGLEFPAAAKTGTSENYHDAWLMGYSTSVVCGVWVGYDQPKSLGRSAAGIALPIWVDFMKRVAPYEPPQDFVEPPGLSWKTIDPTTGQLARSGCTVRKKTAFLAGTEPTEDCSAHAGGIKGLFQRWRSKT